MEKAEMLENLVRLLESVTRMVSVITIGQRLTEATTDSEREYLSRALSSLLEKEHIGFGNNMNGGFRQDQTFDM